MHFEAFIHAALCNYLHTNYPAAIFTSDLSGVRLPAGLARRVAPLKSCRGIPDIIVLAGRGGFAGLLMELKVAGGVTKGGHVASNKHSREQGTVIQQLRAEGYAAFFVCGYDGGIACIDWYMNLQENITQAGRGVTQPRFLAVLPEATPLEYQVTANHP